MTSLLCSWAAVVALATSTLAASAQVPLVVYEIGVDQEVMAALPLPNGPPLVLLRRFLEPRKARLNPERAASDTLHVVDRTTGRAVPVLSYKADAPLWIGPALPTADGVAFTLRAAGNATAAYTFSVDGAVRRMPLPWERAGAEGKLPSYERLFLTSDGVIGVHSKIGVDQAEIWVGDATTPEALDTFIQNGDGRVIAIDDVAEIEGRVVLLMTVASGQGAGKAEIWLLSFDRSYKRKAARAMRLETGTVVSSHVEFVRSALGVRAVRVTQRDTTYGRPTIKLFPVSGGVPVWNHTLPRVLGADDVAITGVCARSFLVLRSSEDDKSRNTVVEWLLVGPGGQEMVIDWLMMPVGTSLTRMAAAADRSKVWSYVNFSRLEDTRRPDGWYGWRGYRGSTEVQGRYCQFE